MNTTLQSTYLDESQLPYPFCPGCGHGKILDALNAALVELALDPRQVVIVTDIGCVGLSDRYFAANVFHGLHGRSVTYATGIKLANPALKVIVLIGDGGCGIGGHHLINAARRNIGVTTLVFNNLNYGMTGGEHSVTTPLEGITATTPLGQIEQPLDICGTAALNGASFVARKTCFDKDLPGLIAQAIRNEGFSLVDIWELCTAYYVPNNRFSKRALEETLERMGFGTGILKDQPRQEFSQACRNLQKIVAGEPARSFKPIAPKYQGSLSRPSHILIAGDAGTKINSAATAFGTGAVLSGLWAMQRDDYPVTVKTGHSIAEIRLSPEPIGTPGFDSPDLAVVLFPEGLAKCRGQIRQLTERSRLYISADLADVETQAQKIVLDFRKSRQAGLRKEHHAIAALGILLETEGIYPLDAFKEAISANKKYAEENLAALEAIHDLKMARSLSRA